MSEDAMREAIARRLADYDALYPLTDAEWEAMRDVGAGDYFGQADAVLAVVRGVDADQWEQVGCSIGGILFTTDEIVAQAFATPPGTEVFAVYRRVVPVVPSPEPAARLAALEAVVRKQYAWCDDDFAALYEDAVASPDRCPTCGSEKRNHANLACLHGCTVEEPNGGLHPWHRVPSTEGDQ